MKVALFTSVYFNNIGNGFLDLGTEMELKEALPADANIVKISQCANFAASLGRLFAIKEMAVVKWIWSYLMQNKKSKQIHNKAYSAVNTTEVFSPASMFYFDYLVIPGCVLTIHFFKIYIKFLENKTRQGCKIVFIGASGNYYTEDETSYVSKCLSELKPYAIMTRDSVAYKLYKEYCQYSYNGIDNAFFVNKLNIPHLDSDLSPYVVVNLESPKNEKLKNELVKELKNNKKNIIYTDHCPYPYTKVSRMVREDSTVVSDYPLDYLNLYRNVDKVYSDRVHACITTLSLGNTAILYSDTPRKALFENVGIDHVPGKEMRLKNLDELQMGQIKFLKSLFK